MSSPFLLASVKTREAWEVYYRVHFLEGKIDSIEAREARVNEMALIGVLGAHIL